MDRARTPVAVEEIRHAVGDIGEDRLAAILALRPTFEELEQAVMWADAIAESQPDGEWPLSGKVGEIFEILTIDLEDEGRFH